MTTARQSAPPARTARPRRTLLAAAVAALALSAGAGWWLLRDETPYELHASPAVQVDVRAEDSVYPDAETTARDVEELLTVYVQRLRMGDTAALAELGAPSYTGREKAAAQWIRSYGALADDPVRATVLEPVVPYIALVDLRFSDGEKQRIGLTLKDDVWWVDMGDGDPSPQ